LDECGICDGDGPDEGLTCDEIPLEFVYIQSTSQAFYYFNVVMIDGIEVSSDDWVGAFNGDTCVGSRKWDTTGYCINSQYADESTCEAASEEWIWHACNNGICDLPVMGDDGSDWTSGYMQSGNVPNFKIYDASENQYYDVYSYPQNYAFEPDMTFYIEELVFDYLYSIPLHSYNNLISFYTLPEDNLVPSVMLDIEENITAVFGEAVSAQ
jgi:hypothetical protein